MNRHAEEVISEAASAAVADVRDTLELLVDGCIIALEEHSTEALLALIESEKSVGQGDKWVCQLVVEYLTTWRDEDIG